MTDHSISTELLGCPFCAADCAELTKAMGEAWIRCPHCDATGGMSSNEALAIKNWNARALTTASDAVAAELKFANEQNIKAARKYKALADERAKELATLRGGAQAKPRLTDNDAGEISVTVDGKEVRGWSYRDDSERRIKMLAAREYVEGWNDGREA